MYNLWEIRKRKGVSLPTLSARTGIPLRVLQDYELGSKPIPYEDLSRIAKALYVEEWEIKTQSDPPPEAYRPPSTTKAREEKAAAAKVTAPAAPKARSPKRAKRTPRPARRKRGPAPAAPARETQLAHLRQLAPLVGKTIEEIEQEAGKPLNELTRQEASRILFRFQEILRERKQQKHEEGAHNRKRAYLPEGVDRFELDYLTKAQKEGAILRFHLFDGTEVLGQIVGFSPYAITVRGNGEEITLNKLAIAWYTRVVEADDEQR